ncbi:uncharacterized protein [Amphiura filiformis]|uniref:uncharacterized protein n=1 Tax=Amphiura filiformis TaxID=82378 RepID=UPI003B223753
MQNMVSKSVNKRRKGVKRRGIHAIKPLICRYCTLRFFNPTRYHIHVRNHLKKYRKFWVRGMKGDSTSAADEQSTEAVVDPVKEKTAKEKYEERVQSALKGGILLDDLEEPKEKYEERVQSALQGGILLDDLEDPTDNYMKTPKNKEENGHKKEKVFVYFVYPPGTLCECDKENVASKLPCDCDFAYKRKVFSSVHQMHQSMQGRVGYTCKECKKHVMEEKPSPSKIAHLVCKRCGDTFARTEGFEKHQKACHGYSPRTIKKVDSSSVYQCVFCGHFCKNEKDLQSHVKNHTKVKAKSEKKITEKEVIIRPKKGRPRKYTIKTPSYSPPQAKYTSPKAPVNVAPTTSFVPIAPKPDVKFVLMYECMVCALKFSTMDQLDSHRITAHPALRTLKDTGTKGAKTPRKIAIAPSKGISIMPAIGTMSPVGNSNQIKVVWKANKPAGSGVKKKVIPALDLDDPNGKWQCEECPKAFKSRDDLRLHTRADHRQGQQFRGKIWRCQKCNLTFPSRDKWKGHNKFHKDPKSNECKECGINFDTRVLLRQHCQMKHDFVDVPFSAFSKTDEDDDDDDDDYDEDDQLSMSGASESSSSRPKKMPTPVLKAVVVEPAKTPNGKWKCEQCEDTFKSRDDLRLHNRMTHRKGEKVHGKVWKCLICNIVLPTRDRWKGHGQKHKQDGIISCRDCGIYFDTQENFVLHLKSNHNTYEIVEEPTYVSEEPNNDWWPCKSCSEVFPSLYALKRHTNKEHWTKQNEEDELWPCLECTSSFRSYADLRIHVDKRHLERKIWTCETCSEIFETSAQLQEHNFSIHKYKPPKPTFATGRWVCHECGEILGTRDELRLHRKEHQKGDYDFKCVHCGWVFQNTSGLEEHSGYHRIDFQGLKCKECNEVFTSLTDLKKHLKAHTDFCQLCGLKFTESHNHEKHLKVCALEGKLALSTKCPECGEEFKKNSQLRLHVARHAVKREKLTCKVCGERFQNYKEIDLHNLQHKTDCKLCGKKFATERQLNEHLETHVSCKYCGKKYDNLRSCKRHMSTYCPVMLESRGAPLRTKKHAPTEIYKRIQLGSLDKTECYCDQCGRKFNSRAALRQHRPVHFRNKYKTPTKCPDCEMLFKYATQLRLHQKKTHWPEKPFPCMYCRGKKRFKTQAELAQHERGHTVGKKYQCTMCNRRFSDCTGLKYHMNIHTGVKPYKCQYCPKSFNQPGQCKTHERRHEGHRPYKCHLCTMTYTYGMSLKIHLQTHVDKGELESVPKVIHSEELQAHRRARTEAIKQAKRERLQRDKDMPEKNYGIPVQDHAGPSTSQPEKSEEEQVFEAVARAVMAADNTSWNQSGHAEEQHRWHPMEYMSSQQHHQGMPPHLQQRQQQRHHLADQESDAANTLYNMIQR